MEESRTRRFVRRAAGSESQVSEYSVRAYGNRPDSQRILAERYFTGDEYRLIENHNGGKEKASDRNKIIFTSDAIEMNY